MFLLVNTGIVLLIIAPSSSPTASSRTPWPAPRAPGSPNCSTPTPGPPAPRLAYQISAIVSGFTPFVVTLLFVSFGWIGPAPLFSTYAAIGLVAALVTRETWGPRERQLADEAAAAEPNPSDMQLAAK